MRQLVGGCLLAAGILIAGVSGICTLFLLSLHDWRDFVPMLISLGVGVGLIFGGQRLIDSGKRGYRD